MYHDQIDFSIVLHGFFGFLKINIQLFTRIYLTEHESLSLATLHAEGAEGCCEDSDDEIDDFLDVFFFHDFLFF